MADENNGWGSWPTVQKANAIDPHKTVAVMLTADECQIAFASNHMALVQGGYLQERQQKIAESLSKKLWEARKEFDK